MQPIDLNQLSRLVSVKTGNNTEFKTIEKIGSGYHSEGYKLTTAEGKTFFLKYVRSHDLGFEFPERQIMSLMVSNGMAERSGAVPPVGVIVVTQNEETILSKIDESTKVFTNSGSFTTCSGSFPNFVIIPLTSLYSGWLL